MEPRAGLIVCDVGGLVHPDAGAVAALARLQLAARRRGRRVVLRHASRELEELVEFMGLDDVLRVEARRQAEEREQALRVEEEADAADPPA